MSDDEKEVENHELTLLEADIDASKSRLERVMGELGRRRHSSFDLKELLGRHKLWVGAAAVVVTGGVLTAVLVHEARQKSRRESLRWRSPLHVSFGREARGRKDSPAPAQVRPIRAILKVLLAFTTGAAPVLGRYVAQRVATTPTRD